MRVNWKRNLFFVYFSQCLSITGFTFALPFVPYYMQELGVTDPDKLKVWVALFGAGAPLSLAVFSPVWGTLADRFGRRIMLLRANFGAAIFLYMMGMANSVGWLVFLRLLQGVLTGTMSAAQTLVAAHTPQHRSGFALGLLSSGVFSGGMFGAFFGGVFADTFGYRPAFFVGASLMLLAGCLIFFGTHDPFVPPARTASSREAAFQRTQRKLLAALPVLCLLSSLTFVRRFDLSFLPLLVQEIHGSLAGSATRSGSLNAVAGVAGLFSGLLFGHMADRNSPRKIGIACAVGGALFMAPQAWADSFQPLFAARFGLAFCAGGLEPVFQSWLSDCTPPEERGVIFGWSASARSIGWMVAPLVSGMVAWGFGLRAIFLAGSACFLAVAVIIHMVVSDARMTKLKEASLTAAQPPS